MSVRFSAEEEMHIPGNSAATFLRKNSVSEVPAIVGLAPPSCP
jgi:hypothetical protein